MTAGPLAAVVELIRREAGISLPPARATALQAAINRAAPGLDLAAFVRATADARTGKALVERLIDEVTVQESSFLRDAAQLKAISWHLLNETATGRIRVWSAGCAAGEEVYTLALLATEAFAPEPPPVDVLGTDICHTALAAAAAGRYRARAVRDLGMGLRQRYLEKQPDGTYLVGGQLRKLVRFAHHNFARDPIPPLGEAGFDLVVCRNVMIYFTSPVVQRVSRLLERALHPGGVLVLGAADVLCRTAAFAGSPPDRAPAGSAPGRASAGPAPVTGTAPQPRRGPGRPPRTVLHPAAPVAPGRTGTGTPQPRQPAQPQRPTERPELTSPREECLRGALDAAGRGDMAEAIAQVTSLVETDPLDADAHFLHGLLALEAGDPTRARDALRSALYADHGFGLAAFTLGRAYDALGDRRAARRAYEQALRTLDPGDSRHEALLQQIDMGDIAAACRARLGAT